MGLDLKNELLLRPLKDELLYLSPQIAQMKNARKVSGWFRAVRHEPCGGWMHSGFVLPMEQLCSCTTLLDKDDLTVVLVT